ncbi:putative surface protein with fasciclin (FAS1) repeats [Mariniflexile fucanivorans]|uniref:Putative surface protein with fasciclin (FAS1) repeats n=1 Tax=Mariniflexile fucanivorans TaxID=264023 RepID=A0A4R1RJU8_9FLAO|nr:fasciclin domain-containing protein [Mariniflexile fucanivorans]TCL66269.1 putative surface protein with fasciclin (FAS1) repeats [Mariniflexile fucanivorans]
MRTNKFITWLSMAVLIMVVSVGCKDKLEDSTYFTSDDLSVIQTLEANPEVFSSYVEILLKTGSYNALKSYGNYTCFAPTNEAVKTFLKEKFNVETVAEISSPEDIEYLRTVVKFQTIPTGRGTSGFVEGRISDTTYTGDFLTTSFLKGGGIANVEINREVGLTEYDIKATNGIIHAINGVLHPYVDPVTVVMEKAGKHTIFVEALKQTGYFDKLSVIYDETGSKNSFTVLAESDEVYAQEGINSFDDLVNRISPGALDFSDSENELNRFVAYHVAENFLYSINFPNEGFITTILPRNAWKVFKTDKELKINETETGVDDTWTSLISAGSNLPAKNGVYHTVDKLMPIFTPKAKYLIFDLVTDQPEYQQGIVKSGGQYTSDVYSGVRWYPEGTRRFWKRGKELNYKNSFFDVGGYAWIEFDTPIIPKGKYEMLILGNGGNNARAIIQVYWDGEPIGSLFDMTKKGTSIGWPDEAIMESNGWRHGYKCITDNKGNIQYDNSNKNRFIITKELLCPEQKSHVVRLQAIKAGNGGLDFIEFIPVIDNAPADDSSCPPSGDGS